jgi:hypothetical protein
MYKAKLFFGLMYTDALLYEKTKGILSDKLGIVAKEGPEFDFSCTDYYTKEFGQGLKKRFIVMSTIILRTDLPKIKQFTCELETRFASNEKRQINIDPGYITLNNVVVASTKEFSHRIYLGEGIFGDLQMVLKKEKAEFFVHTYADYREHWMFFHEERLSIPKK